MLRRCKNPNCPACRTPDETADTEPAPEPVAPSDTEGAPVTLRSGAIPQVVVEFDHTSELTVPYDGQLELIPRG